MDKQHECLGQLLELTEQTLEKAKAVSPNMEVNEEHVLLEIQDLFDKRQTVIDQMESFRGGSAFDWSPEGKETAQKLLETEQQLNPLMNSLHQAFANQMNRINQTKQLSQKYRNSYQTASTDGTFFDTRK